MSRDAKLKHYSTGSSTSETFTLGGRPKTTDIEEQETDYIKVCSRKDSEINKCINNSIEIIRPKLISGIAELAVPPIEPLALDEMKLSRGPRGALLEALIRNIKAQGASDFIIEDLKADLEANTFDVKLLLPKIVFEGDYQLRMNILIFNVFGKGRLTGTFKNYKCDVHMKGTKILKNNETFLEFERMKFKLQVGNADIHLSNLFNGDPTLGETTNRLINENSDILLPEIIPALEVSLAKEFTDIANRITLQFTYDELFP
ncbi:protein takeout [Anabrus simplex]|uniref:protein takeout n=1 Tax=Anabrus simplex TaxID=316456 RepID=UPI0035A2AFA0